MKLCINGQTREFATQLSIAQLLSELQLPAERVVVELNREILTADKHTETELKDGDTLELVQFVGGG